MGVRKTVQNAKCKVKKENQMNRKFRTIVAGLCCFMALEIISVGANNYSPHKPQNSPDPAEYCRLRCGASRYTSILQSHPVCGR